MNGIVSKVIVCSLMCTPMAVRAQSSEAQGVSALPPDLAFADPVDPIPGSPRRKLIAGWVSLGVAALNIVQIPLCISVSEFDDARGERVCIATAATIAALGLSLGLPLTISGHRQRARRKAWLRRHHLAAVEPRPWLGPRGGGGLKLHLTF